MSQIIKFPAQYYIAVEGSKPFSTAEFPLAFATPFGTDKAFLKRKKTVDDWSSPGGEYDANRIFVEHPRIHLPEIFNNEPLHGFTFDESVSRYSTSNKVFRINDPRGFTLEISAENLSSIILESEIRYGEFVGKYLWGRAGSGMYLASVNHRDYKKHINPQVTRKKIRPGDLVVVGRTEMIFVGEFYFAQNEYVVVGRDLSNRPHWSSAAWEGHAVFGRRLVKYPVPKLLFMYNDSLSSPNYPVYYVTEEYKNPYILEEDCSIPEVMPGQFFYSPWIYKGIPLEIQQPKQTLYTAFENRAGLDLFNVDQEELDTMHEEVAQRYKQERRLV